MKIEYVSGTLSFLKMTDDRFVQSYKSPAFHQKIRIVALQNAPENPKNVCSSVCKSQNVCPKAWIYLDEFGRPKLRFRNKTDTDFFFV